MQPSSIFSKQAHRELLYLLERDGDAQAFFSRFSERYIHIKQLGIERNTYLNWEHGGLIPYERSEDGGWRKFSLIEAAWIKTIQEMRALGVSTDTIRKLKEWLFSIPAQLVENLVVESNTVPLRIANQKKIVEKINAAGVKGIQKVLEESQLNMFSLSLMRTLIRRMVHLIVIYKEGDIELFPLHSPADGLGTGVWEAQQKLFTQSATMINLWAVVQQLAFSEKLELEQEALFYFLSEEEKSILSLIQDNQYSEVIITKDGKGKPTHIKLTKKGITPAEIKKLLPYLKRDVYQTIQFKTRDGQLIQYEETRVIKLGKEKEGKNKLKNKS